MTPDTAVAGRYYVGVCRPGVELNNSVTVGASIGGYGLFSRSTASCPGGELGVWLNDQFAFTNYATGASWNFSNPPAGTTLDGWYIASRGNRRAAPIWPAGGWESQHFGAEIISWSPGVSQAGCPVLWPGNFDPACSWDTAGVEQWEPSSGDRSSMSLTIGCAGWLNPNPASCSAYTGNGTRWVQAYLESARVQLTDATNPTINGISGGLGQSSYSVNGSQSVTFSASDATNIRYTEVTVDAVQVDIDWESCYTGGVRSETRYTYKVPCQFDVTGRTSPNTPLDTTGYADGVRTIQIHAGDSTDVAGFTNRATTTINVTFDNTPPPPPASVADGTAGDIGWTNSTTQLSANWPTATDASGIQRYEYCISTSSTGTDCATTAVATWTTNGTSTSVTRAGLTLASATTYYVCVQTFDGSRNSTGTVGTGNKSTTSRCSNGQTVDNAAPPQPAWANDGTGVDITWTGSSTQLEANWAAVSDPLSGLRQYRYCISTSATGADCAGAAVVAWTATGNTSTSLLRTGLGLSSGTTYYVCVRAEDNALNLGAQRCTNGQTVDTVAPPQPASANDGPAADIQFTSSTTTLEANWSTSTDALSGTASYQYCMSATTSCGGTPIVGWTSNAAATSVTRGGLTLTHGTTYYTCARAIDNVGNTGTMRCTNGQTVNQAPNVPTLVSPPNLSATTDTTPDLVATFSDPDGVDTGQLQLQVCVASTCAGGGDPQRSGSTAAGILQGANGTWTVSPALADGTWYWRARAVDQYGMAGAWSATRTIVIGPPSMSIAIPTGNTVSLGLVSANTDVAGTSTIDVATNAASGFSLTATDADDGIGMTRSPASDTIDDWTGTDGSPSTWAVGTSGTNGYFGLTVLSTTGGRLGKWGAGSSTATDYAANVYAGVRSGSSPLTLASTTSYAAGTISTVAAYRIDTSPTTQEGSYSTTITYTAVPNP